MLCINYCEATWCGLLICFLYFFLSHFRFTKLKSLNLSNNNLGDFPLAVCGIPTLTELNVSCNALRSIPAVVGEMHKQVLSYNFHIHSLTTIKATSSFMPLHIPAMRNSLNLLGFGRADWLVDPYGSNCGWKESMLCASELFQSPAFDTRVTFIVKKIFKPSCLCSSAVIQIVVLEMFEDRTV